MTKSADVLFTEPNEFVDDLHPGLGRGGRFQPVSRANRRNSVAFAWVTDVTEARRARAGSLDLGGLDRQRDGAAWS